MQLLAVLAFAQMPWTNTLPARGLALNYLRPKFDGGGTSVTTGAAFLSARFPTGSDFSLRIEVPYAYLDASGTTSSAIGNPYAGLETTRGRWTLELGFRPALAPDDELATSIGLYSDITRLEAWTSHVATLATRAVYRRQNDQGITVELGVAPSIWISTEGGDNEIVLNHHASVGHRGSNVWMELGLGGVLAVTESGDFGERSFYQIGASVGLTQGQVRPALHFILPLDDAITSATDYSIGVGLAWAIK